MKIRSAYLALALCGALGIAKDKTLFDGKDLEGWKFLGRGDAGFVVKGGLLETSSGGKGLLWYTPMKLGNGTLHVVYKMSTEEGNSGVFIRIPVEPRSEGDAINKGIEVQIDNRDNEWHSTGVLYSMTKAKARPYKPAGEWNTMDITFDGLRTVVKVNDVLVTDYDGVSEVPAKEKSYEPDRGPRPEAGYIGLQNHDDKAVISFREITWKPNGR